MLFHWEIFGTDLNQNGLFELQKQEEGGTQNTFENIRKPQFMKISSMTDVKNDIQLALCFILCHQGTSNVSLLVV